MSVTPCFLSVEETCKQLSISNSFFYLLVKRGRIRIVKLGRRTLVPLVEIQGLSPERSSVEPNHGSCGERFVDIARREGPSSHSI